MSEGKVVVNHYYKEAFPKSELPKDAPILEVPEFKGGVSSEEPPVLEVPEFNGAVNGDLDDPLTLPELNIPKETNENSKTEEQISKHQQKIEQSSKGESKNNQPVEKSKQKIKEAELKDANASNKDNEQKTSVSTNKVEELPRTGTGNEFVIFGAAASSILAGLGLVIPVKQKKE